VIDKHVFRLHLHSVRHLSPHAMTTSIDGIDWVVYAIIDNILPV